MAAIEGEAAPVIERKWPHRLRVSNTVRRTRPVCRPAMTAAAPQVYVDAPLAAYRKYTEAMLRRYQTLGMEAGRVPSLLGREMFRGKVTNCRVRGFDDVVIFVHDVGRCLEALKAGKQYLIRRIALQQYTQGETAAMAGLSLRTVVRRYAEALDELTELFLRRELLEPLAALEPSA